MAVAKRKRRPSLRDAKPLFKKEKKARAGSSQKENRPAAHARQKKSMDLSGTAGKKSRGKLSGRKRERALSAAKREPLRGTAFEEEKQR